MQRLLDRALACEEASRPEDCSLDPTCCGFGELTADLDLTKGTVSRHLTELEQAGLIERRREGRRVYVRADVERIEELRTFLDARRRRSSTSC